MNDTPSSRHLPVVTITAVANGYDLKCKDLGISCTASSIEAGYAALREIGEKAGVLSSATVNEQIFTLAPSVSATNQNTSSMLSTRSSKFLLFLTAAMLLPLLFLSIVILNDVRIIVRDARDLSAIFDTDWRTAARSGSMALSAAAKKISLLTPERQDEMRRDVEIIAEKLAPIASGLKPLLTATGLIEETSGQPNSNSIEQPTNE